MQKVERKRKAYKKSGRLILLLVCLALAAGGATAAVLLGKGAVPPQTQQREAHGGSICRRELSEIRRITVTLRGKEPWTAQRGADGQLYLEDGRQADSVLGNLIQDALANVVYEDILTEDPAVWRDHPEEFGLADPLFTAAASYTDGSTVTMHVGDACGLDDETFHYMTVDGDDRLYAVAEGTVKDLNVEKELLYPVQQPETVPALLDRITVRNGAGEITAEWRLSGKVTDPDAASAWRVTAPFVYPADEEIMDNLKENAGRLRLGTYVCAADEEALKQYGFMPAPFTLELHTAAGTTGTVTDTGVYDVRDREESTVVLPIGAARNEMTDYVLWNGQICTVNHFLTAVFTETDPFMTAARYVAVTPLESLHALETERGGETNVYSLTRETAVQTENGDDGEESVQHTVCTKNGTEIPYETFEAAYQRLMTVTVSGRLPQNWTKGETTEKYTFRSESGGTRTVEFSAYDAMHDAVTVDGCTLFYLIRGGMTELP